MDGFYMQDAVWLHILYIRNNGDVRKTGIKYNAILRITIVNVGPMCHAVKYQHCTFVFHSDTKDVFGDSIRTR